MYFWKLLKRVGKEAYRLWLAFAHALAFVNTKVLLTLFFVLVIGPIWLVCFVFRIDFLDRKWKREGSYWRVKDPVDHSPTATRHQF